MNDLLRRLDEAPVTMVIGLAYGTLFVLSKPFEAPEEFGQRLNALGWLTGELVAAGAPWRLLSYAFLHGNVLHLLLNLSALVSLGFVLERALGSLRFLLLYAVASLGGGLGTCLLYDPRSPVVGGSGALFGMLGAAIALNMRNGRHLLDFLAFEGPRRLLGLTAINLAIGFFLPYISNTCHVGGLVAGFALTFLWLVPGKVTPRHRAWRLAVLALSLSTTFAVLMPVTRSDWLLQAAGRAASEPEAVRLLRAAAKAAAADR